MFADAITKTVTVPGADGKEYEVTIRKLNARRLKLAADARQVDLARQMKAMGGEIFAAMQDAEPSAPRTIEMRRAAHRQKYDRDKILEQGIVSWNATIKVTPEQIERLDLETAELLFNEIVDLSDPFKTEEVAEAEHAKG